MSSAWEGKVVLVTGGSGGLGKSIAEAFARRRAKVVLAARGVEALQELGHHMRALGYDVLSLPADITQQPQVDLLFQETLAQFGRLDVLVNSAGRSTRRAVLETTPDDFREMLELNFLAAVRCTRAAAPHLIASKGHIVNIGSLASKVAARYLGAYPASKFALAAYSQQLRLELGPEGVHVLLVCPGPIARDRPRTYGVDAQANLPESAARPGGGARTKPIPPDVLAEKIVAACQRRRGELIVPARARLLFALSQLWPSWGDSILRRMT
jgi:NAD(P)-dependent dehydrogenase (short-subunit alcohol dehydrogenase family)